MRSLIHKNAALRVAARRNGRMVPARSFESPCVTTCSIRCRPASCSASTAAGVSRCWPSRWPTICKWATTICRGILPTDVPDLMVTRENTHTIDYEFRDRQPVYADIGRKRASLDGRCAVARVTIGIAGAAHKQVLQYLERTYGGAI